MTTAADLRAIADTAATELNAQASRIAELETALAATPRAIRWGSSLERRTVDGKFETYPQTRARVERTLGRLQVIRHFHPPSSGPRFPTELGALGDRRLVYSWKRSPLEVRAGQADAAIHAGLAAFAATGTEHYVVYEHEADSKIRQGQYTAADYRAAFDRFALFAAQYPGVIPTAIFTGDARTKADFRTYCPQGAQVLGWDPYKWDPATSVASMLDPIRELCAREGKPWGIAETGVSVKHTPAQRAAALRELAADLAASDPLFVCYFDSDPGGPSEWNWPISDEPDMALAWLAGGR